MTSPEIASTLTAAAALTDSIRATMGQTGITEHTRRATRTPTLMDSIVPLSAMAVFLGIGSGVIGYPLQWMMLASAGVAAIVALRLGYTAREMSHGIAAVIRTAAPAMLIMLSVGILIATWISAGTIPMLIYFGLKLMSARFFLVTATLLCSAISLCTGTSWGTIGTVGVALMGIAHALGVPLPAAAGAVISGAYFGDKLSPLSDQTNLAPAVVGVRVFDHIRWLLWTTGPAWLLGLALYVVVGFTTKPTVPADMTALGAALKANFHFSVLLVVPPLIMLWYVITNRSAICGMLLASGAAAVLAILIQGEQAHILLDAVVFGYRPVTTHPELQTLLARGGLLAMAQVIPVLLSAFAFAGIVVRCGLLDCLLSAVLGKRCDVFRLVTSTILSGVATGVITGSSHLSIIVPGQLFSKPYRDADLAAKNLSRTTEDSGTVIVPLIPWSAAGVFAAKTLGVATVQYLPWAIMNYTGIVFAVLYAATGIAIAKRGEELAR